MSNSGQIGHVRQSANLCFYKICFGKTLLFGCPRNSGKRDIQENAKFKILKDFLINRTFRKISLFLFEEVKKKVTFEKDFSCHLEKRNIQEKRDIPNFQIQNKTYP